MADEELLVTCEVCKKLLKPGQETTLIPFHPRPGLSMEVHKECAKEPEEPNIRCSVIRQDDHGNTYVVKNDLSKNEAEDLAAKYESRGHKQTYWVVPE